MKKKWLMMLFLGALIVGGTMMLSAYTTPYGNDNQKEISASDDDEELIRSDVAVCNENGICKKWTVNIYRNKKTNQLRVFCSNRYYDLTRSNKVEGYNYRFWYADEYCYVYINENICY